MIKFFVLSPAASPWSLDAQPCRDRPKPAVQKELTRDKRKKDTSANDGESAGN
jgi:hypothetical protein